MNTKTPQPFDQLIYLIRGHRVMLSTDLARLYEVEPRTLIQAVKRNKERFPEDFMFQLTLDEAESSRSQIVILNRGQYIKYAPYAFTEHGVLMLSSVLNSRRAIHINIAIMRAFVNIRETLSLHKELAAKLQKIERDIYEHDALRAIDIFKDINRTGKRGPSRRGRPKKRNPRSNEVWSEDSAYGPPRQRLD